MLKAKPKGSGGWQKNTVCTLGISMGNPNCTGERLRAVVDWLNEKSNFEACMIDLSDTLNRHNIMLEEGVDEETARMKATEMGHAWQQENQATLDLLKIPYSIIRWEQWFFKEPEKVEEYKKMFEMAFETDKPFRDAVLADVERYYTRNDRSPWKIDHLGRMKYSINYLLEELAVHSLLCEPGPVASVYPGDQQESFRLVREGKVPNVPTGLQNSHFVRLNVYDTEYDPSTAPQVPPTSTPPASPIGGRSRSGFTTAVRGPASISPPRKTGTTNSSALSNATEPYAHLLRGFLAPPRSPRLAPGGS